MAIFLLVHGGWHGGWCWAETERVLRSMGHISHAPTLTGLGELSHLAHPDIDADLHVTDICNVIRWRELDNVILVGHSYGGMVITGVAGQLPEKIRALVYLDALVPKASDWAPSPNAQGAAGEGYLVPLPPSFDRFIEDSDRKAWARNLCTSHPVNCFSRGVTMTGREAEVANRLYILAEHYNSPMFLPNYEHALADPAWQAQTIATLHDAMIDQPEALAGQLDAYSRLLA